MCLTTCLKFLLGKPVGLIFVGHYVTNDKVETDKFELAWNLDSTVWGRGYATEAARAVIQHAKEEGGVTIDILSIYLDIYGRDPFACGGSSGKREELGRLSETRHGEDGIDRRVVRHLARRIYSRS
jgi:hypothetical protein